MKYDAIRHLIKPGDLIAISHYRWASWYDVQIQAVRVFGRTEYSHVAEVVGMLGDRLMIVESVVPVIRTVPLSSLLEEGFYWTPLPEMSDAEFAFLTARLGKGKYSKLQAIMAQIKRLAIGADDLWECAELLIIARRLSGVDLGGHATPSAVVKAAQHFSPTYFVTSEEH